jgi:L-asparaginase
MGGTFGSIGAPLYPMPAKAFLEKLQQLSIKYQFQGLEEYLLNFFEAPSIKDSSELSAIDWLEVAQQILELSNQFQHFIIIHGTDTLHYASAFLSHLFTDRLHIIVTGSQFPLLDSNGEHLHVNSDAWTNYQFSIAQIKNISQGCYTAFAGKLHHANQSIKTHTTELEAFQSNSLPRAWQSVVQDLDFHQIKHWILQVKDIRITNLYCTPSPPDQLAIQLNVLSENPPQILILQTFGSGNLAYSASLKSALQNLIAKNCWVIISSQVLFGELSNGYAVSSWLSELGVIIEPHYSQADLYARSMLLYLQYADQQDWQSYWRNKAIT